MQALADWANQDFVKIIPNKKEFVVGSIPNWLNKPSPLNDKVYKQKTFLNLKGKLKNLRSKKKIERLNKLINITKQNDPFDFSTCCAVLGLNIEKTRELFELYRLVKLHSGHSITIVNPTLPKKDHRPVTIQSDRQDVLEYTEYLKNKAGKKKVFAKGKFNGKSIKGRKPKEDRDIREDITGVEGKEDRGMRTTDMG